MPARRGRGDPLRRHPPAARADGRALRVRQGRGARSSTSRSRPRRRSTRSASSIRRRGSATCSRPCGSSSASSRQGAAHRLRRGALHARELPRSRAARARDFAKTKRSCTASPSAWHALMDKLSEVVRRYLARRSTAGADACSSSTRGSGSSRPSDYSEYVQPHVAHVLDGRREQGVPGHPLRHRDARRSSRRSARPAAR